MILGGEERDILISKNVMLVQSGHFKSNVDSLSKEKINSIDDIIFLDYMGSSEFEWGSLPSSLRRMTINKEFYKVFVFNQYKDENGNSLKVYAPLIFFKNVQSIVDRLAVDGYGLQEYCSLHRHIEKNNEDDDAHFRFKDNRNFWWDIENDFFMFFEHTDKVLMAMNALRKRKFGYERNISKNALCKKYIKIITKPNISGLSNSNSSIKEYYYDEKANIHFINFLENTSLENILMESIFIAKVSKGIVRFTYNDVLFSIDENTVLDNIITECGVDLIDSCSYSDKIKQLILSYNEVITKNEKQKQLVRVLKLERDKRL